MRSRVSKTRRTPLTESVTYADGDTQTTTSTYDIEGRLVTKVYPSDSGLGTVSYTYNGRGQITAVSMNNDPIRTYSYDDFDRISTVKDEMTDITCTYTYDDLGRVASMLYADDTGILESFGYGYDKQNNIIERSHVNNLPEGDKKIDELRQYVYDDHGNLTQSIKTDNLQSNTQTVTDYTYDAVGNRTSMTVDGETTGYTYNGLNQLLQVTNSDGTEILYTYDERGNQISETDQDVTTDMEYSVTGEMTKLTKIAAGEDTDTVTFTQENVYDENGIRISRTQDGITRDYYYDRGIVTYTIDNGTLSGSNILDAGCDIIGTYRDEEYHGYFKDGQASTTNIVENDGTLSAAYDYTDFGETTEITGGDFDNQVCYAGGIYDEETALYYLNARYYDPEIGRFISQDPYRGKLEESSQWNLYLYCANNPINYVDPSGNNPIAVGVAALMGAAALLSTTLSYLSTDAFENSWEFYCEVVDNGFEELGGEILTGLQNAIRWKLVTIKALTVAIKTYTKVAQADANIRKKSKQKKRDYYKAWFAYADGYKYVKIGDGLSMNQAKSRVRNEKNVMAVSKSKAKTLANKIGGVVGPEVDKGKAGKLGYYHHYHVKNRKNKAHIFYYTRRY